MRRANKQRLKLRRREKNPAVEHTPEERGEAPRVAHFRVSIVLNGFTGKEKREQRTFADRIRGDACFPQRRFYSIPKTLRARIERFVKSGRCKQIERRNSRAHRQR